METRRIDRNALARLPLVSVGVVLVLLLVFLVVEFGYASQRDEVNEQLREVVYSAINNPMVQIDPRLLPVIRGVLPDFESNELFDFLKNGRGKRKRAEQQQKFDAQVSRAFSALDSHPYRQLGLVPARPALAGFLAHFLVHAGWVHLLATALLIVLAGGLLEPLWGRGVFAVAGLCAGLAGAAAFCGVHAGADRALVGASALASGLVAAVVVRFRSQEVDLLGWLSPFVAADLRVPAWGLGVAWLAYEAALGWASQGALPGGVDNAVGYTAQAVGAAVGGLLPLGIARLGLEQRFGRGAPAVVERPKPVSSFDFQRVVKLRASGDADSAYALLLAETRRSARNRDAVTTFWEMAVQREEPERAAPAMLGLIREELRRGAGEVAVAHWLELTRHAPGIAPGRATLVRLIPLIRRVDGDESATVALRQAVDPERDGPGAALLCGFARLAVDLDREIAVDVAERGLAEEDLDEVQRAELEAILARFPKERAFAPVEAKDLPVNAFFEEQDRSGFGEVGDLMEFGGPGSAFPSHRVLAAVPVALESDGLALDVPGQESVRIAYSGISAIAVAGVRGLGAKPVVLVDLFFADGAAEESELRIYRFRSDQFDPRRLVPNAPAPFEALRGMVEALLERSQARPLPDPNSARANPMKMFESLEAYESDLSTRLDV